jgi:hypothetical protein
MALRPFNSIAGISVGENAIGVILANADVTAVNLTASGISNLGPIANVRITGGSTGQVIQTDGLGNLIFSDASGGNSAAPMPYIIPVGESYYVPENFQGIFTVPIEIDGELEVSGILAEVGTAINSESGQIIFDDNGELTGNAGFTFNTTTGNLAVPGSGTFTGNLLPSANTTYDLGSPNQRWKDLYLANNTIYLGNSIISGANGDITLTNAGGGELIVAGNTTVSTLENGNSNISINANANITISVNSTSNVAVFSSNTFNVNGNVVANGVKTDNLYYANGNPWDLQQPAGSNTQLQFNDNGSFGASANLYFDSSSKTLHVVGNIVATDANISNIIVATANVGNLTATGNITAAYIIGNGSQLTGLPAAYGNADVANYLPTYTGNLSAGNVSFTGIANISGNISGNSLTSTSGYLLLGTGSLSVIGSDGGIFSSTISNINLGLAANVTMGSTTGNVIARGSFAANSLSTSGNLTVTGNISANNIAGTITTASQPNVTSLGNLTVLSVSGNANITNNVTANTVTVNDLYSGRTSINVIINTVVDSFSITEYRSAKYTIRAGNDSGYQAIEVLLVHDDINSIITVYGSLSTTGNDIVTLTTGINNGNVELKASGISANTNLNLMGTYVPD